jgi:hypothetical protein
LGLGRETKSLEVPRKSSRREYNHVLEIRPILEKYKLKSLIRELRSYPELKLHRVPRITLLYNFKPRAKDYKIIRAAADVGKNYNRDRFHFFYNGVEVKKGGRGYIIALRIISSEELKILQG